MALFENENFFRIVCLIGWSYFLVLIWHINNIFSQNLEGISLRQDGGGAAQSKLLLSLDVYDLIWKSIFQQVCTPMRLICVLAVTKKIAIFRDFLLIFPKHHAIISSQGW